MRIAFIVVLQAEHFSILMMTMTKSTQKRHTLTNQFDLSVRLFLWLDLWKIDPQNIIHTNTKQK